ncbi:MAG TPA: NDP-sugar synthase [Candidatus Eremiobacteraceae bacterium]|nr:NDP-sugar synthase [Candidatus Eremiobacteraceae bacterium]
MQGIILVGGEGTRLRPLTYAVPKPMAPVLGRPFIGWIIERLRKAGVDDVILSCCYLPDVIEAHFGDGAGFGIKLHYVVEDTPLGTAGAIRNALDLIHGRTYVCNGDILTGLDLRRLREVHERRDALATLHLREVSDPSQFGVVETDTQGRVLRFVEKPKPGETDARDINAGTYLLEREAIEAIPPGRAVSIERETYPLLIETTHRVFALTTADYWIDVGRPESYIQAHRDILDGKFEKPVGEEVAPGIWSADGTRPAAGVDIKGPAYFGRGVRIEPGASIEPYSAIYDGCRVGAGAVVGASIVWPGCEIGANAIVRDAILGLDVVVERDASVAAGSVIGKSERIA